MHAVPYPALCCGTHAGAHKGRGLGRNFLRHLRRTRALLHVVDASTPDPATDYYAVREELRMYNPEYCARPHVVALNKCDKEEVAGRQQEVVSTAWGGKMRNKHDLECMRAWHSKAAQGRAGPSTWSHVLPASLAGPHATCASCAATQSSPLRPLRRPLRMRREA